MVGRPIALLRAVPGSFSAALSSEPAASIDVALARVQHDAYRRALEVGGFATSVLPADDDHPDCPFIEDTAVVIGDRALITRPGHRSRRGEVSAVAAALRTMVEVETMLPPATLDGGDVLQVGGRVLVGISGRTNRAGVAALTDFAAGSGREVIPVQVRAGLHLKSAVTAISDEAVLAWTDGVEVSEFGEVEVVPVPGTAPGAANCVRLPDGRILASAAHPDAAAVLEARGLGVLRVVVSEFAKADGGLTCLSIRLRSLPAPELRRGVGMTLR